jgi:hypothetical protein
MSEASSIFAHFEQISDTLSGIERTFIPFDQRDTLRVR